MTAFVGSRKLWNKSRAPDVGLSMVNASGGETRLTALRRIAASASLGASATALAWSGATEHDFLQLSWGLLGMAAVTGAAAVALLRRTVLAQVLARGVAWVLFLPSAAGVLERLLDGHLPPAAPVAFAASVGAALLLSRPNLNTERARREFAPGAYRRLFLAGAIASATGFICTAAWSVSALLWGGREGFWLAGLSAVMLATSVGVVRMRAWGVLLGLLTALAMGVEALLHLGDYTAWGFALAAIPGLVLAAPLVASRLRLDADDGPGPVAQKTEPRFRIAEPPTLSFAVHEEREQDHQEQRERIVGLSLSPAPAGERGQG